MNPGEKFSLQLGNTEGEIISVFPLGQSVPLMLKNGAYQILMNGYRGIISKELFDVMFKPSAIPTITESVSIDIPSIKTIEMLPEKRRKKKEVK